MNMNDLLVQFEMFPVRMPSTDSIEDQNLLITNMADDGGVVRKLLTKVLLMSLSASHGETRVTDSCYSLLAILDGS